MLGHRARACRSRAGRRRQPRPRVMAARVTARQPPGSTAGPRRAALDDREPVGRQRSATGRPRRPATVTRTSAPRRPARARSGSSRAARRRGRRRRSPRAAIVRSPTRTSIQAPMASRFGAGLRELHRRASGPSAPGAAASPAPTLRQSLTFSRRVDLDEVEQAVEVEVDQGRAPRARRSRRCRPSSAPSTKVPSGWPRSRLLGSFAAKSGMRLDVALGDEQVDEAVVVDVRRTRRARRSRAASSPPAKGGARSRRGRSAMSVVGGPGRRRRPASGACCRPGW